MSFVRRSAPCVGDAKAVARDARGGGAAADPRLAGEARSYAERLFRFPHVGTSDELAAPAAPVLPAGARRDDYDEAVERTLRTHAGLPLLFTRMRCVRRACGTTARQAVGSGAVNEGLEECLGSCAMPVQELERTVEVTSLERLQDALMLVEDLRRHLA